LAFPTSVVLLKKGISFPVVVPKKDAGEEKVASCRDTGSSIYGIVISAYFLLGS
jgi:hypothetical protein